ncbi:heat shock protein transcriptional repressor HspR [Rothia sp. P7208]
MGLSADQPVFVISVAAELAGMHPQTLRQYDRLGLVQPQRAPGRARRYSARDVAKLQEIQQLSQDGVSLEGIRRIMGLESEVETLRYEIESLRQELATAKTRLGESSRVFAAGVSGDIVRVPRGKRPSAHARSRAMVLYQP